MMEQAKTVLVVEDDDLARDQLAAALKRDGYRVRAVKTGEEGLECIAGGEINLVLLDVFLPGMNGLEMLERLRDDRHGKDIPVLMLSNVKDEELTKKATESGAYDYLLKVDWSLDDVLDKVREKLAV